MDFSLHSFILVVGLLVIGFIIFDGIKKVREARANRLDDHLDLLDGDVTINDDILESDARYDDLEITDDLVQGSFSQSSTPSKGESVSVAEGDAHEITEYDVNNRQDPSDESISASTAKPLFDIPQPDTSALDDFPLQDETSVEVVQKVDAGDDASESVANGIRETANGEDGLHAEHLESVEADVDEELESFSAVEEDYVVDTATETKSDKPSKAEVAAKLREAERLARESEQQDQVTQEPIVEMEISEGEPVPVLMEPIELGRQVDPNPPVQHELHLPEFIQQTLNEEPEDPIVASDWDDETDFESFGIDDDDDVVLAPVAKANTQEQQRELKVGERLAERPAAQEIFVINVLKENGPLLSGAELHHIFKACDMRFGEMDIFHRFEEANAQGKIQFSVVNALQPGTFDPETIDQMETKGISLFMSLPGPTRPMEAFDAMAEVALVFSRNFSAQLYDESHSVMTPQTLEHYRHRIREFSRKHMSKNKV